MFLLWGRIAYLSLEASTVRLPVGLGEVRIASDAALPDHWVTHASIAPPLKVRPGGTDARSPLGIHETTSRSSTDSEPAPAPRHDARRRLDPGGQGHANADRGEGPESLNDWARLLL